MARNPKWNRDELILTLDLYFQLSPGEIHARNPKIIRLSEELNRLPFVDSKPDAVRFRNPNGVGLKLSNFLSIDPSYQGKGMERRGKLDEEVFEEFVGDQKLLRKLAGQIRSIVDDESLKHEIERIEEEPIIQAREGQVLTRLHKFRERNPQLTRRKKDSVFRTTGKLACEVCGFDFFETYGELGEGFAECHHIRPLSQLDSIWETRLEDLSIVCSNCHRMLHRGEKWIGLSELRDRLRMK